MTIRSLVFILFSVVLAAAQGSAPSVASATLGDARNVHVVGTLFIAGQFSEGSVEAIKAAGVRRVVSLRTPGEVKWDEAGAVREAKMSFHSVPFRAPATLTDGVFDQARRLLRARGKTLLHCGSANRAGGVWLAYRVLDQGVALKVARTEAKVIGLRTEAFEQRAIDYITRTLAKTGGKLSVKPGINDSFTGPDLDVAAFLKRFEVESREIYSQRREILQACQLKPGDHVADVGAGTGLFTNAIARTVGAKGWVYAVDIAPKFLERINALAAKENLANISSVLCTPTSVTLPPASIDAAFICDTYHHFEYPSLNLSSLHSSIRPGGRLIIVDFERIVGKSRPWILGHVRAKKEVFMKEITDAGFKFKNQIKIKGLKENYFLVFDR